MNEKPAYHCGAIDCCEGSDYPDCQMDLKATLELGPDGSMNLTPVRRESDQ